MAEDAGAPERMPVNTEREAISTGSLPPSERVEEVLREAHARHRDVDDGDVSDAHPSFAEVDPALFGLCVVDVDGGVHAAGDADHAFSIQSIAKAFVFALVCQELGHEPVREIVGVNNTGLGFDSVIAMELNEGHPMNPMVNAGALATTSLVPGDTSDAKWELIHDGLSRFAGRRLELDDGVYETEVATNQRNMGIARLLEAYGRMKFDPAETTDVYSKQCSLLVTTRDLAVMGATLADGGVNPVSGERVVDPNVARDTLAVLASTGHYEGSGDWLFENGLPGKSGVSGGIVAIAPGKGGLASFSPRLDPAGTSVRGQQATAYLSAHLGLDLFASWPKQER